MRRLGYLSGAPRVSTRPEAEASGPRAHVLGVMNGFLNSDWDVNSYIVGDMVPMDWIKGSEKKLEASQYKRLAADFIRVGMAGMNSLLAWRKLNRNCDWVYERFGAFQSMGSYFSKAGIPWIVETNAPIFYEANAERKSIVLVELARRRELSVYRSADVLITVTEALKDIIVDAAGIPAEKVLVVPNGVDTARFNPMTVQPKRIFEGATVGFVGSLISWQALEILIDSVAELKAEGITWNVSIAGDGPMRSDWEYRARQVGISSQVSFLGRVPWSDIPALISGFDFGYSGQIELQVGKMYLSPLKLYEYMAMGKPVIASAFEDTKRVVCPGQTGYLFNAGEKESLKQSLRMAYAAKEGWREMGDNSRKLIVAKHSWNQRVANMIVKIEDVLKARAGGLNAIG